MNYKPGDILTTIKDFIAPVSGMTFYYYRGSKYKVERYLECEELAYKIVLVSGNGSNDGYFSVTDLHKLFSNIKEARKEKIKRIDELYNTR